MKCYFNEERVCPVPNHILDSGHCKACAQIDANKISKEAIKLNENLSKVYEVMVKQQEKFEKEKKIKDADKDKGIA